MPLSLSKPLFPYAAISGARAAALLKRAARCPAPPVPQPSRRDLGPTGRCPTCLVWRFTSRLGSFCKQLHDIRRNGQNGHVGGGDYPAQSRPAHTGPAPGACQLFAAESRDVLDAELDNLDLGCAELVSQVHLGPTIPG
jgi:hypothetical protein